MKGIVNTYLNERVKEPSLNAANPVYYEPGDVVEIVDILNGQEYEGNKIWYQLDNGAYVWSGGIEGVKDLPLLNVSKDVEIKNIFTGYEGKGEGVGIAVLDSGVNVTNPILSNRIRHYESFISNKSLDKIHSHGHKICGVLSSEDNRVNRNLSNLYCFRVSGQFNEVHDYAVYDSLKHINNSDLSNDIDFINMSINISDKAYLSDIQEVINQLKDKGIVSIISAGENLNKNLISQLENTIKIGTFDLRNVSNILQNGIPFTFTTAFLNIPISTYSINSKELDDEISDDSAYAAYISALVSRYISTNMISKDNERYNRVLEYLQSLTTKLKEPIEQFKLYK